MRFTNEHMTESYYYRHLALVREAEDRRLARPLRAARSKRSPQVATFGLALRRYHVGVDATFDRGIDSCLVGGGFGDCGQGTSFAAPYVSGLLALILEGEPDFTPAQQRERLLSVCTPRQDHDGNTRGAGLVSLTGLL